MMCNTCITSESKGGLNNVIGSEIMERLELLADKTGRTKSFLMVQFNDKFCDTCGNELRLTILQDDLVKP